MRPPASPEPGPGPRVIGDPLEAGGGPRLGRELLEVLAAVGDEPVVCDIGALGADLATVDLLARLKLAAARRGRTISFVGASPELAGLLALAGLNDVLGLPALALEPGREAEEGEQARGVEERVEPDDAPV